MRMGSIGNVKIQRTLREDNDEHDQSRSFVSTWFVRYRLNEGHDDGMHARVDIVKANCKLRVSPQSKQRASYDQAVESLIAFVASWIFVWRCNNDDFL